MRMKDAIGRSESGKCDEEQELGLKESKVHGRWGLTMRGLTSTTMSVDKSRLYVATYAPPAFRHKRLGVLFAHQVHPLNVGYGMRLYDFDC